MCIKTKQADNILEKFKVILKGKVFLVRAKELFTWTPTFLDCKESGYYSNNESLQGENLKHVGSQDDLQDLDVDSDVEGVASDSISSFSHPPGFIPVDLNSRQENIKKGDEINLGYDKVNLSDSSSSFSPSALVIPRWTFDPCQRTFQHEIVQKNDLIGGDYCNGEFDGGRLYAERHGSTFNQSSSRVFNNFITSSGLVDVNLEGYSFTWSHPSASKMSKLYRFLVSEGIIPYFPSLTALCLDRHLSDHRPILLRELSTDYGPTPFYHSWFKCDDFDAMVEQAWNSFSYSDANGLIRFKKKLQDLKKFIRSWVKDKKLQQAGVIHSIKSELIDIDKALDRGNVTDEILFKRMEMVQQLHDAKQMETRDNLQKSKIKWAIEGDKNSKYFHGIINKKRSQMSIRGIFTYGEWKTDPGAVKEAFKVHFADRFKQPINGRLKLNISFNNRLSTDQVVDLDRGVSRDELQAAVWDCRDNKSPGPDGFTFEFFRRYWRQILDGPFILNELLDWCKRKKKQAMIFKVDFAKAYDSVCWDYLLDVLHSLVVGPNGVRCIGGASNSCTKQHLGLVVLFMQKSVFDSLCDEGECMSRKHAWDDTIQKLHARLSNWKVKTLSIGGMEAIRQKFLWVLVLLWKDLKLHGCLGTKSWRLKCMLAIQFHMELSYLRELHVLKLRSLNVLFLAVCLTRKRYYFGYFKVGVYSLEASFQDLSRWKEWISDLSGDGKFRVKVARTKLDDVFLPSDLIATRWVKFIPIKAIFRKICRWWDLDWYDLHSFSDWLSWFSAIRLSSSLKLLLEGVFYTAWWHLWAYRNQSVFRKNLQRFL
ncbi:RNA-directed DNA polymerase, eukaryota [Tanacetum coccineum]